MISAMSHASRLDERPLSTPGPRPSPSGGASCGCAVGHRALCCCFCYSSVWTSVPIPRVLLAECVYVVVGGCSEAGPWQRHPGNTPYTRPPRPVSWPPCISHGAAGNGVWDRQPSRVGVAGVRALALFRLWGGVFLWLCDPYAAPMGWCLPMGWVTPVACRIHACRGVPPGETRWERVGRGWQRDGRGLGCHCERR